MGGWNISQNEGLNVTGESTVAFINAVQKIYE